MRSSSHSPTTRAALFATLAFVGCTGSVDGTASGQAGSSGLPGLAGVAGSGERGVAPLVGPGRTTLRRLTVTEYKNTIGDLTGDDATPLMAGFPADGRTAGFDNIAATLGVAPSQLEIFEAAAMVLAARALEPGSAARQKLVQCADLAEAACQRSTLEAFARRAWRRPVTMAEVDRLLALARVAADAGASADQQVRLAFHGILVSPHFLFRVELMPQPAVSGSYRVNPHELASRLSYFLWSSMPDDALFTAASVQSLEQPAALSAEVTRMLADPKAEALTTNFASQWLGMRALTEHAVDKLQFPDYGDLLAGSMSRETSALFRHVLVNQLPVSELLTARYGFMDAALAEHYGVPLPALGSARVDLAGSPRSGLLGQAGILTLTSYPNRTSVVRRGVWVLENLLCTEPPPPPEGVDTEPPPEIQGTLRQRMQQHRADPACAGCHTLMDPIGFALENFDPIGRFRTTENGETIDASGVFATGAFTTVAELSQLIAGDERFVKCALEKLLVFALGRTLTHSDESQLEWVEGASSGALTLRELVVNTALSEEFASQRSEP